MYESTKRYVKHCIRKLMNQCGITIDDIQQAVTELRDEQRRLR